MNLATKAVCYSKQNYNCSQCMLKAAEHAYYRKIPDEAFKMCEGISTGFGVGGICSCLVAGIMIFGLLFDSETVKRLRLLLLTEFSALRGHTSCTRLKCDNNCETLISEIATLTDAIIKENNPGETLIE